MNKGKELLRMVFFHPNNNAIQAQSQNNETPCVLKSINIMIIALKK